jgi:DNA (cytosine-5)-methyltransferase 1|tara:strand:- start:63 stop:1400 length:1338 start_codon:yes stop_codon:yes gene_type:complete
MNEQAFGFLDLFAGIGGFHHALEAQGGSCVLAVERDEDCQQVYRHTFPNTPLVDDIRSLTQTDEGDDRDLAAVGALVPDHDVLCAGFPCQPFSKSGFQEGIRDRSRGTLFYDVMTIIMAKQPRFVLLENVRNIAGPRHIDTWNGIIDSLQEQGYQVARDPLVLSPHLLAPADGGAPQVRDRVFILAYQPTSHVFDLNARPLLDRQLSLGWSPDDWRIEDYLDDDKDIANLDRYQLNPDERAWVAAWQAFIERIEADRLPGFPIWVDAFVAKPNIPPETPEWKSNFLIKNSEFYCQHRDTIDSWMKDQWGNGQVVTEFPSSRRKFEWQARKAQPTREDRDLAGLVLQMRPSGIRVKPSTYLPALVAITQTSVVGSRMRRVTPREAARLQGVPSDLFAGSGVKDSVAYKQLGNAVNVGVVSAAATALFKAGNAPWMDTRIHELRATG